MRTKLIALMGAILLVTACETPSEEAGEAAGTGAAVPSTAAPVTTQPPEVAAVAPARELTLRERLVQEVGDRVFFDFDRSSIRPDGEATLRRQAELMLGNPGFTITIAGHADERGTREYNLALGERRATTAKNYLVSLGVDASRVNTISYGKERPIVLGHAEAAWAQNRVAISGIN
jgi:peptidoglycan-associated lipoprotein